MKSSSFKQGKSYPKREAYHYHTENSDEDAHRERRENPSCCLFLSYHLLVLTSPLVPRCRRITQNLILYTYHRRWKLKMTLIRLTTSPYDSNWHGEQGEIQMHMTGLYEAADICSHLTISWIEKNYTVTCFVSKTRLELLNLGYIESFDSSQNSFDSKLFWTHQMC